MKTALAQQPNMFVEPVTVQRGDVWALGNHRLCCGDSTSADDVRRLFDGSRFSLCFTSPPYSDQRQYKLGAFNWHSLMCGSFEQIIANGKPDCHILINLGLSHKNRQVDMYWLEWLLYCASIGWPIFGWYVWDKGHGMPRGNDGRLMMSHEFIFHFNQCGIANKWVKTKEYTSLRPNGRFTQKDGTRKVENSPDKFGQPYRVPDSIISIHRERTSGIQSNHPAVFPVALPEFIMQTWSHPGDIVYEPFCGSGTSIIAGENLNRKVYSMEISEEYCSLALTRFAQHTGIQPTLLEGGDRE